MDSVVKANIFFVTIIIALMSSFVGYEHGDRVGDPSWIPSHAPAAMAPSIKLPYSLKSILELDRRPKGKKT
jgi:hypothetical protein